MSDLTERERLQDYALLGLYPRPVWVKDGMSGKAFHKAMYGRVGADERG
jgi:hypothetical protein